MKRWQVDAKFCLGLEMTEEEAIGVIRQLCESKAEELHLYGYHKAKAIDVWACVSARWKPQQTVTLHGLTSAILTLKAMDWMNWLTVDTWKNHTDPNEAAVAVLNPADSGKSGTEGIHE